MSAALNEIKIDMAPVLWKPMALSIVLCSKYQSRSRQNIGKYNEESTIRENTWLNIEG